MTVPLLKNELLEDQRKRKPKSKLKEKKQQNAKVLYDCTFG
jgi:hypothetical protein